MTKIVQKKNIETFFGWRIVYASMVMMIFSSGIGFHCNAVILDPLRNFHGWNKSTISAAITLYFFINGIAGIYIGKLVDRYGSKPILVVGAIINGIGLILLSVIDRKWQLFLGFTIMSIGFTCTSLIALNVVINNWFVKKRGVALSIALSGISLGGIIMVPLASFFISFWGINTTLIIIGTLLWVTVIPLTVVFIKQHPSDLGQWPDGERQEEPLNKENQGDTESIAVNRKWTNWEAMQTMAFWAIVVTFLLVFASQIAINTHQISFLSQYLGINGAAFAVSIATGASVVGRFLVGAIIDKYDKRLVFVICILWQAIAILILAFFHQTFVLYLCTGIFGFTMGVALMTESLLIADCFGMNSFGSIFGFANLFIQCGAAFGPLIAGIIYDTTKSYQPAYVIFAIISCLAGVAIIFAKPPTKYLPA